MQEHTCGSSAPEIEKEGTVLGRCLVEGDPETTSLARRSRRKTFGVSLLVEILLLGLLVASPLLTTVAQPNFSKSSIAPFVFRGRPSATPQALTSPALRPPNGRQAALTYATTAAHPISIDRTTPAVDVPGIPGGEVMPGAGEGNSFTFPGPSAVPPAAPTETSRRTSENKPLRLSEPIVAAQLITRVEPRYPPLGIQLRQSGIVVLHAIIGRDGDIRELEVVSGSGFFIKAALDAVRQWRYRPTLLNGEPVEVETTITVVFQLKN